MALATVRRFEVSALVTFNGHLYAGTTNSIDGARIFRSPDGVTWTPVTQPGFGIAHDIAPPSILDLVVTREREEGSFNSDYNPLMDWKGHFREVRLWAS